MTAKPRRARAVKLTGALLFSVVFAAAHLSSPNTSAVKAQTRAPSPRDARTRAAQSARGKTPWWKHAVFYEIYPRSFKDSDGDGVGDLNGITSKLDYLARLGVDAVWITPFYPSPQVDFGYDVSDYEAVDPQFGTLADFDRLVREAHRRRIKVIIDFVLNHTSDQHPFFKESRSSKTSRKRDWYVWHDPKPDGSRPNNWSSSFGPVAWTLDEKTGQFYYHYFYPQQPELNWRNPEVERRMFETVRFWLRRGADGFRLDAVNYLFEDPQLRDNPVLPELRFGSTTEHEQEKKYNRDLPEVQDAVVRLRAFNDRVNPESVLVGEAYVPKWEELMRYYGPSDNGVHLPFNFFLVMEPARSKLDAGVFRSVIEASEKALAGRWTTYVLSNHDIPRHYDRLGDGRNNDAIAKLTATMLLTLRGSPFLYYGEEIGMVTTEPKTIEEVRDPVGKRYWPLRKGRDGERTPMQWDASAHSGFTTGSPWLPVPPSAGERNVAAAERDPESLLNFYKQLISLRRRSPALLDGDYKSVGADPHVYAYVRRTPTQSMLVALNMSAEPKTMSAWLGEPYARVVLTSLPGRHNPIVGTELRLAPFEAVVLELETRIRW
ncbi:MAG TPA: alpha-glucosidase [Pyrinomonadaceae bacterium]|nr:alpha-glucosidase [Pyrinomonadaceae bacterium]